MKLFGFISTLLLLFPMVAGAQGTARSLPPTCTAATLADSTCIPQRVGAVAIIRDGDDSNEDCTGGGATVRTCEYSGSAWLPVTSGTWTGANGETIYNDVDAQISFDTDTGSTITLMGVDDGGAAHTIYDTAGNGIVTVGSDDVESVNIITEGDVQIHNGTTGVVSLDLRDYADTTDDDMAHVLFSVNCTTTTTGAEDCNLTISTTEAGSNEIRILIDGDGDIDLTGGDVKLPVQETATFGAPDQLFTTPANADQFIGVPRLNVTQLGASLATGNTLAEGINPSTGTCAPITAGSEAAGTLRITGANSYQYTAQGTAADNDGFDCDVTGPSVGNSTDSIGFWFRSDTVLTAGTLDVSLDDGGAIEANADLPAITVINEWQWIEVDFATDCDATCTGIDGFFIQVTTAGAATSEMDGTVIHIDSGAIWLDTAEEAIGDVIVGGVISVSVAVSAFGTDNTASELVEYTDYIVNYQTGSDVLVMLTDQSANYGWTLEALND